MWIFQLSENEDLSGESTTVNEEVKHEPNEEYEDLPRVFDSLARITEKRDVDITLLIAYYILQRRRNCRKSWEGKRNDVNGGTNLSLLNITPTSGFVTTSPNFSLSNVFEFSAIKWRVAGSGPDVDDEERDDFPYACDFGGNEELRVFLLRYSFGGKYPQTGELLRGKPVKTTLVKHKIPTRGLPGLRNSILTASRGTAVLNSIFDEYGPWAGDISTGDLGSLLRSNPQCKQDGTTTSYALLSSQERGQLFIGPGVVVYKGQMVGIHQRPGDLSLNVYKKKAVKEQISCFYALDYLLIFWLAHVMVLDTPLDYSLDDCIEYIQEDELVEITLQSIRMCKNQKMAKKTR
ncbi:elongation factor -like SVR3, chloroplastic isoform X1 [Olea europaea subsp. europaea]|uniref:Elongation factor -like SVR3, chloroplastic isoform X1 n=1 Tax=Olea europaea subsp. europaea TaxID=158383 RepID=A0A8S0UB40_OLEEU|nr:elongation factor -like SVR3, chloroplastic isoform X1 [Olea europaea subsp. europaea]